MDWFTLLIGCGLLMAVIAVLTVLEVAYESKKIEEGEESLPPNISKVSYDNTVVIKINSSTTITMKNEATEYARSLLISSLLTQEHDSIKQYIPVHIYSNSKDITDRFEYHSIVEVKGIAIAIRLLLANNTAEPSNIDMLIVKSQEDKDLFILNLQEPIQIEPFQKLYLIWYIQLAAENVTEAGIAQLLTALAYANTQYKHSTIKDIVLLDSSGSILPFYTLAFNIEKKEGRGVGGGGVGEGIRGEGIREESITDTDKLHITAYLKNNTAKEQKVKTIAVRNTNLDYIFAYDLEEELLLKPYSKISIKVEVWS
ncbi:MAG: hypothetical protein QXO37_08785 [Candidatus Nitrosocaldaceae archaeon]